MAQKRFLRAAVSILTLAVCAGLIFSVTNIYLSSVSRRALEANAALPIFTRETVAPHLKYLLPLIGVWAVFAVCAVVLLPTEKHGIDPRAAVAGRTRKAAGTPLKTVRETTVITTVRCVLLIAAVILLILGVLNGGLNDVLVKAINICTECIGLG